MVRLLLADDHEVVREGLRHILHARPDWEVVAEAADGKEAVRKAIETNPDVAIVDYSLPLMNGIEVTRQIGSRLKGTQVLIFTMHDSDIIIGELLNAGARGYLLKADANTSLKAPPKHDCSDSWSGRDEFCQIRRLFEVPSRPWSRIAPQ
jgi:DNA-binding NarL/FixJ family response regulator